MAQSTKVLDVERNGAPPKHDWTFASAATRELTHCYHDYPARMIPQVAGKLLDTYAAGAKLLLDPYCGSGTTLVEGMVRGISVVGTDLNPLACLISKAKTAVPDLEDIDKCLSAFDKFLASPQHIKIPNCIPGISRLDFWFKPQIVEKLSILKHFVDELSDVAAHLFFQIAFSETVRETSNTRNEEFKLYRYDVPRLERFEPDVFGVMTAKLKRNRIGLAQFLARLRAHEVAPRAETHQLDMTLNVPANVIAPASVDIVVTSPPYGDSHTTVAYGQYSRLSAAWLGLESPAIVDRKLMGGVAIKSVPTFPGATLNDALKAVERENTKRAGEVASFYSDLYESVSHVAATVRCGGYVCYVVGNRKVKGVVLPTADAIRSFFECFGFEHANTFHRSIPNKRMPLRNSPSNAVGAIDDTMTNEHIVIMRRK